MPPTTTEQRQLQTLGQLLSAGGHHDVPTMLRASLERLVTFWPAQAGALLYQSPLGEQTPLEHGALGEEAARMIGEAREAFAETLCDLLAGLQAPRAHVVGAGLGGTIGLTLAADHPECVDRLAVLSCALDDRRRVVAVQASPSSSHKRR